MSSREVDPEVSETWPALTFYYGLAPSELAVMPRWILKAYIDRLPELLAQSQLDRMSAAAYPHLKDPKRLLRQVERAANIRRRRPQVNLQEHLAKVAAERKAAGESGPAVIGLGGLRGA